jgi:hypothetical protein
MYSVAKKYRLCIISPQQNTTLNPELHPSLMKASVIAVQKSFNHCGVFIHFGNL